MLFYNSLAQSRQGQVTVFIIIGILILFIFAGILYFTQSVTKPPLTAEKEPIMSSVPQAFQPLQDYTDNCLTQIGKKSLLILGQQGGYIYPSLLGKFSASDPTGSVGLDLEPVKVPYWHYNSEPNTGDKITFSSLQPKLSAEEESEMSVEAQLARFVGEKLSDCLGNYTLFRQQGFEISYPRGETDQEVQVLIMDEAVGFWLKKEIGAKKGSAEHTFAQFYVKLPLKLKEYYEVASNITQVEQNYGFLERQALDLIATYSAVDVNKLPPTEAFTFDPVPTVSWSEAEVKEKVQGLLTSSVPLLRYLGSKNFYRYEYQSAPGAATTDLTPLYQKNYDNMIFPLELGENLKVNFDYFGWEPYFDLNDKNGKVEPSDYGASFFQLDFHTQHYYTTYDLSYPILVTITDDSALDGEGYTFVFALESNLRNSQIVKSGDTIPAPVASAAKSMVCDENKRSTELVKSIVVDSFTQEPLEAVQIGFSVPGQDDCVLGLTDSTGTFEGKYPPVYGGVGSYLKPEYLTAFYPVDTYQFKKEPGIIGYALANSQKQVIPLHKIKTIKVTVKKKSLEKCINHNCFTQSLFGVPEEAVYSYQPSLLGDNHSWVFVDVPHSLGKNETATLILNRVSDFYPGVYNDDFTASATFNENSLGELQLVPGKYSVMGLLTDNNQIVIPSEKRCKSALWGLAGEECVNFERNVLEKSLSGQIQWDYPPTYLTITPEELYNSDELTFYLLNYNLPGVPEKEHQRVMEDLQVMGALGNLSQQLRSSLEPRYS